MSKIFATNKMRISGNKTKTATITLVLALTIAATLITYVPAVNATLMPERDSYAFITVSPNPVGVGQDVLLTFGITEPLPDANYHWIGLEVTVTDPDGNTEDLHPTGGFTTESTGSTWTKYTPSKTGEYSFQCYFPAQWLNRSGYWFMGVIWIEGTERHYKEDTSDVTKLTVQEEQVGWAPSTPPPTDYWERPIYNENWEWSQSAGNWLEPEGGSYPAHYAYGWKNLYTDGPESGHIMWTREIDFGGLVGGEDLRGYYSGMSYERKYASIIMNGKLYYNLYLEPRRTTDPGFVCVDLYTGEELWRNEDGRIYFGQILEMNTPNQHGSIPYLWGISGTTYTMYRAFTGQKLLDIANVSRGTRVIGPNGEILIYNLYTNTTTGKRMLSMWNATRVEGLLIYGFETPYWRTSLGAVLDGRTGYQWRLNVTSVVANPALTWIDYDMGVIVCKALDADREVAVQCAYAIKDIDGHDAGDLLWTENRTGLVAIVNFVNEGAIGEGIFTEFVKETRTWYAFDAFTGTQLWTSEPLENQWGMFYACSVVAYGNLYTAGYDGCIHCYDIEDGTELWSYYGGDAGYETPYGHYPFFCFHDCITVADGKVYAVNGEHSPSGILYKGEKLHCINATDGSHIWNISCWALPPAVADGYAVTLNLYDGRIYCYGKGPSETTAAVSSQVVEDGSKVLITGTVTDQSVAQPDTPCVSQDSMKYWMAYLHMQQPMPSSVTGVPVLVEAYASNGSIIQIGWFTSDTNGFRCEWTPPFEGVFTVLATFIGTESYGSSWGGTAVLVTAAPAEEAEAAAYTTMDLAIIAVVVVIAILVVYDIISVRKLRK